MQVCVGCAGVCMGVQVCGGCAGVCMGVQVYVWVCMYVYGCAGVCMVWHFDRVGEDLDVH